MAVSLVAVCCVAGLVTGGDEVRSPSSPVDGLVTGSDEDGVAWARIAAFLRCGGTIFVIVCK